MLLRHAETENVRPGARDHARRLTPGGEGQAAALGDHLRGNGSVPDVVLCSPAIRARQTAEALRVVAPVVVTDALYNAGTDDILAGLHELADDVTTVLVVGHAPGLPALVHELADPDASDPQALATVGWRFPACTLAVLSIADPWDRFDRGALLSVRLP
jgi:phosphohistidine phosphatase